jgi:hypothetical protein
MGYDIGYKRKRNSISLFAWHEVSNFGDKLGPAMFYDIVKRPVCIEARRLSLVFGEGPARTIYCFLGTFAHFLYGQHHFVLWGVGMGPPDGPAHHGCKPIEKGLDIDFRALRGPLTREEMVKRGYNVPRNIPYGDPGLLIPYFYKPSIQKKGDYCLVPHHAHYNEWKARFPRERVIDTGIDSYDNIQSLVTELTSYDVILSGCLHATITAEAFGIPTSPLEPTLPFKFDDFYQSVNKKVEYIMSAPPNLDFSTLAREVSSSWRPIEWEPKKWLATSPFIINADMNDLLSEHYSALRLGRTLIADREQYSLNHNYQDYPKP